MNRAIVEAFLWGLLMVVSFNFGFVLLVNVVGPPLFVVVFVATVGGFVFGFCIPSVLKGFVDSTW